MDGAWGGCCCLVDKQALLFSSFSSLPEKTEPKNKGKKRQKKPKTEPHVGT